MAILSKVLVVSSLAVSAAALAGVAWWMYKRRQRQSTPLPLIRQWPYWRSLKKIASLPSPIQDPECVWMPAIFGENTFNPLHPDSPALFFMTWCTIEEPSDDIGRARISLWRHSLFRDKATPCCSFEVIETDLPRDMEFVMMGRHLFVGLVAKTSVDVLVFSHQGEFLKRIHLEDTPIIRKTTVSYLCFEENHCHLLVSFPAVSRLVSYKFQIDPVTNRGNCIQRNTIQMPQNMEFKVYWTLGDGLALEMNVEGQMRDVSDPVIFYDFKSTSLTLTTPGKVFSGRLINWNHQNRLMSSLQNFENEKSISFYGAYQRTSTLSPLDTTREGYLVLRKNIVEDTTDDCTAEEEAGGSDQINVYSFQMEPRSLKSLALSAVLKNLPWVKDLPEGKMRELGIPPNIAHTLEQHKGWESEESINLEVL